MKVVETYIVLGRNNEPRFLYETIGNNRRFYFIVNDLGKLERVKGIDALKKIDNAKIYFNE